MKKIYIFPRYGGNEDSDWYKKAEQEMLSGDKSVLVTPLSLPNWDNPDIITFLSYIERRLPQTEIDSDTYFVGHSVGCRAVLLYLNELKKKNQSLRIGGLMCVAGWWTVDNPWPQLEQWINISVDYDGIREMCNENITTLISDNDPFTSNTQLNKEFWEKNLNAKVLIVPNAKHFNNDGFDVIVEELRLLIS